MSENENLGGTIPPSASPDDIRSLAETISKAPPTFNVSELLTDEEKDIVPAETPVEAKKTIETVVPEDTLAHNEVPVQPSTHKRVEDDPIRKISDKENAQRIRTFASQFSEWAVGNYYYKGQNSHVTFDKSPFTALPADEKDQERFAFPATTFPAHLANDLHEHVTEFDATRDTNSLTYLNLIESSKFTQYEDPSIQKSFEREGSDWRTRIQHGQEKLGPVSLEAGSESKSLFNLSAISRVISALDIGQSIRIPLTHSGFWVDIAPVALWQRQEFNSRLSEERLAQARNTYGRAFSNTNAVFTGHIFNFALSFVRGSSLKVGSNVGEHVDMRDIPVLVWGLARATWPRGWRYYRAIPGEPNNPDNVVSQMLNLTEMCKHDTSQFSPWQLAHLAETRQRSDVDPAILARYKDEFTIGKDSEFVINPDATEDKKVRLIIGIPKAVDQIAAGERWLTEISELYKSVPSHSTNSASRDQFIMEQTRATRLRMYSHFIKKLMVGHQEVPSVEDRNEILSWLSGDDVLRERVIDFISDYKRDSIVTAFGIPTSDEIKIPLLNHPHLIAVDPLQLFFIRLVQEKSS